MAKWFKKYRVEILIVVGGAVFIHLFLFISPSFNDRSYYIDSETASRFGDFIGGYIGTVFLLVSIVLLYATLRNQRELFQIQQFENKFFEMLRIARDNSTEVESKGKKGRSVFVDIKEEIETALKVISEKDKEDKIAETNKINIAYLITFYGVNNSLTDQLKREAMKAFSDNALVDNIVSAFEANHKTIKSTNENFPRHERQYLEFDGHQSRLGHYFRHLFQTINYVDDQNFLSYEQKYFYVRTLRAQWSTHEQAIFFFNALSNFGKPWELSATEDNKKLLTKYNLIKNIPNGFIRGIDLKKYFPNVRYEGEIRTNKRIQLERNYS